MKRPCSRSAVGADAEEFRGVGAGVKAVSGCLPGEEIGAAFERDGGAGSVRRDNQGFLGPRAISDGSAGWIASFRAK